MPKPTPFDTELPALLAIPRDALKRPRIPIDVYVQEAYELHHWCKKDRKTLTDAGLDWQIAQVLPLRARVLQEAEARWFSARHGKNAAQKRWQVEAPRALALRNQLLRTLRFAFQDDRHVLQRVAEIRNGRGYADLIQDLSDVARLATSLLDTPGRTPLNRAQIEDAGNLASDLGKLWAEAQATRMGGNPARDLRDRAYTHLKAAVDEVRACGQYCFWNNEPRLRGYGSRYLRLHRRARPKAQEPAADMENREEAAP